MKRTITITFDVDMKDSEYKLPDTDAGAINSAVMMMYGDEAFPHTVSVKCGNTTKAGVLEDLYGECSFEEEGDSE
jgi:hypothetical protein